MNAHQLGHQLGWGRTRLVARFHRHLTRRLDVTVQAFLQSRSSWLPVSRLVGQGGKP